MSLSILIIDDHPLVSQGLASLAESLDENVQVSIAQNAQAGIERACQSQPDLILLDLHMPDMDGFTALDTLSEKLPTCAVVVISGSQEAHDMQRAIQAGAMGFIPKTVSHSIMLNALKLVVAGGVYIPPEMLNVQAGVLQPAAVEVKSSLTPRQLQVLVLLSEGLVNKQIARQLDCAETTVKAHVTAIFKELHATNRTEAVMNAQKRGLL